MYQAHIRIKEKSGNHKDHHHYRKPMVAIREIANIKMVYELLQKHSDKLFASYLIQPTDYVYLTIPNNQ